MKKSPMLLMVLTIMFFSWLMSSIRPVIAAPMKDDPTSITMDSTAKSGVPGSFVSYTLSIANNSGADLNNLAVSVSSLYSWVTEPGSSAASVSVADGATSTVNIKVAIPSTASSGQNDSEAVTITDSSSNVLKTFSLTTSVKSTTVSGRPVVMMSSYYLNSGKVAAGYQFELAVALINNGQLSATNVVISFDGGTSFFPQGTGGVSSTANIDPGGGFTATQSFLGAGELAWTDIATIKVSVSYTDSTGTAYSESFSVPLTTSPSASSYATATPNIPLRPQMVVTDYKSDVDLLQPGTTFSLSLDVRNMGQADASAVTMVLGGGVSTTSTGAGTPQPGGVSGSSGELTNFAPLNSSNLVYIGDLKKDATTSLTQKLIVNVTTQPGVYTLKISFIYTDPKGNRLVDDQVITLLVYSLPQVEVNFYRDPGVISAGMSNVLPIQVTNLGKKTTVLGNMKVTAEGAEVSNNVSLVGALDSGGYYTLDANIIPEQAGNLDVLVTINYTDDFNQSRTVEQKISIDVQPAIEITPDVSGMGSDGSGIEGGTPQGSAVETFWHKVGRFFKGLFGLDSSEPTPAVSPTDTTTPGKSPISVSPKG